ncbi:MAG: LysR family transcriptional regulator [Acidiphilium sp.]|nr:LysR family transcriptional regulator [Acidiphilium sp.]MDD4936290.1 LysR family transcriptional regulator [Acidiphilium sp.]
MNRWSHYRTALYFDAVRRHGAVREAARHLGIAASAVNRRVLHLEEELGLPLFERSPGGMSLTPAGEVMARHAIAVLQDERRTWAEFDALRGLRRGEIAVIAAESLNARFMPAVIERMASRYPGIKITLRTEGSNDIPQTLMRDESDIGIAFSLRRDAALQQLAVGRLRLGAVMQPNHPLVAEAIDGTISFAQCARHRLVLPSPDLSIHSLLAPLCQRFEGRLDIAAEANSVTLMKNLALRLDAVAFQARVGIEAELASAALVFLPLARPGPVQTELGVYLRQGRSLSPALDVFVALAREQIAACEAED